MMMTIDEIRKELGDGFMSNEKPMEQCTKNLIEHFATKYFGRIPYVRDLVLCNSMDETGQYICGEDRMHYDMYDDEDDSEKIDYDKTFLNILKEYPDSIVLNALPSTMSTSTIFNECFILFDRMLYIDTPNIPDRILKCIENRSMPPKIKWILRSSMGYIDCKFMEICPKGDLKGNYNDDFYAVDKKIRQIIHSDESGIIILHGKPGTGKTSYIRNLIYENTDITFYWVDSTMFSCIDSSEFVNFIKSCKNSVFVLEDSESLLRSRDDGNNPAMQALLSMSDGMLGDSLKLKFICTFNTDLRNIDDAILRKGRMKVKYEFKDLEIDKVRSIFKKIGIDEGKAKPMTLSDVYNYTDDNGNLNTSMKKVGFNRD